MALQEWLGNFTPTSVDTGFDNLIGLYKTVIKALTVCQPNQYEPNEHYKLELEIVEVLDGNGSPGRTLLRNYDKTSEVEVKKLLNELFTAGLSLKTDSVEALEESMTRMPGATVYVRAWEFKKDDGNMAQYWAPKAEKNMQRLLKKGNASPF